MKKFLLILALVGSLNGISQAVDSLKDLVDKPVQNDSNSLNLLKSYDSLIQTTPAFDSLSFDQRMERNISSLVELQKNRRSREKRNAMIRIGIGVTFLIVLFIGLRRKKAKK